MNTKPFLIAAVTIMALTSCEPAGSPTDVADAPTVLTATDHRVIDGDTIRAVVDGEDRRVRLLGIDTPEAGECGHQEATDHLETLLQGAIEVTISLDPVADTEDRFGRILGYLNTNSTPDAGYDLIAAGYAAAWWPDSAPTPSRGGLYQQAQQAAVATGAGSWGACETVGR